MKVTFLNQGNEGFAKEMEIDEGTRIDDFLFSTLGEDTDIREMKVRVNGEICTRTSVIPDGARVVVSPMNIKGA